MQHHPKQQKGSALLMVLVITTIIASLATMMLIQQRYHISDTQDWIMQQRMRRSASFCMPWAMAQLQQPIKAPTHMPSMLKNTIQIDATLSDAASQFNLNQLKDTRTRPLFARLLMQLDPALSATKAFALSNNIATHTPAQQGQTPFWLSNIQLRDMPWLDPVLEKKREQHTTALPSTQAWNLLSMNP